jgi:hypothetical protein
MNEEKCEHEFVHATITREKLVGMDTVRGYN